MKTSNFLNLQTFWNKAVSPSFRSIEIIKPKLLVGSIKQKKQIYHALILVFLNLFVVAGFAQTPGQFDRPVGTAPNPPTNVGTTTSKAIGVGTTSPGAWQEIKYCPPANLQQNGLVITLDNCSNPNLTGIDGMDVTPEQNSFSTNTNTFKLPDYKAWTSLPLVAFNGLSWNNPIWNYSPSNSGALLWLKTNEFGMYQKTNSRFIVLPDGKTGINTSNPRGYLDVISSGKNTPAAIFGHKSQFVPNPAPGAAQYFTRHLAIMPWLDQGAYNSISQNNDIGIFFTDGKGTSLANIGKDGSNENGAFVIAPWSNNPNAGGLRMEANGNTELRGNLRCTKLSVTTKWWPDYVFAPSYKLMPLKQVQSYILTNKHLPGMPSQDSITSNGQDIGQLQVLQQEKIEELTLYIIEQDKKLEAQAARLKALEDALLKN